MKKCTISCIMDEEANTYHGEFFLIARSTFQREKRAVVSNLTLPLSVKVICHHVDVILKINMKLCMMLKIL